MPKKVKKEKKKVKNETKIKNKNKNKNIITVNVNSHNKKKTNPKATENKNPAPQMMPYVINAPQPQSQPPIIIQQPAQPNYLHYQPPNPVHLGSQNASVPLSNNVFQSPRKIPVRIPISNDSNAIQTQTELTGVGLSETLQNYQNRINDLYDQTEANQIIAKNNEEENLNLINALRDTVDAKTELVDDMNDYITNLRREKESLFSQLNTERQENQLIDKEYQQKLKKEEDENYLLSSELFATQMDRNNLRLYIDEEERSRGKLREGKSRQLSPLPDNRTPLVQKSIRKYASEDTPLQPSLTKTFKPNLPLDRYVAENTPIQPSLSSAFRPINPAETTSKYIAEPTQNQQSDFLDPNATQFTNPVVEQNTARADSIEPRNEPANPVVGKAIKKPPKILTDNERKDLIGLLFENENFLAHFHSTKGLEAVSLNDGSFELVYRNKRIADATLKDYRKRYLS